MPPDFEIVKSVPQQKKVKNHCYRALHIPLSFDHESGHFFDLKKYTFDFILAKF